MKQERKKGKKLLVPKYTWTVEGTDALIEEWKIRPLLFDCSHKEYHMKDRRRIAVESIQRKLSSEYETVPLVPVEEIVKKMNNLRTYFNAEQLIIGHKLYTIIGPCIRF